MRARNLQRFIAEHFPTVAKKININDILTDTEGEIMNKDLEDELKIYFHGKCYGYY